MFTKDNAKVAHYSGTTKEATEQGYEVVSDEGLKKLFKPSNNDVRLGQCSEHEVWMADNGYDY